MFNLVIFFIIFIFQSFSLLLTGFFYKLLYELCYNNFLDLFTFLMACFCPMVVGIALNYINKKFFHYELKNIFIHILLSSIIIILSFCMCIGLIKLPEIFDSVFLYFWVYLFSAKGDPMRVIGLGLTCIPTLIIIMPIIFFFFNNHKGKNS